MPYSLRGTNIEALDNPMVETSIMSEFLAETLLGKMPLVLTNKLFKSPSGLIFKCSGIARAVLIIIEKTKVHLDLHILAILEFDLLIGYPTKNLFQEKPSHGILNEEFGKIVSTTYLEIPMAKHHSSHYLFEEVKFISNPCETERSSPPPLESKPCPSDHQNIIFEGGRDSTMILHDISLENKNFCAMDMLFSTPCSYKDSNHLLILVSNFYEIDCGCICLSEILLTHGCTIVLT